MYIHRDTLTYIAKLKKNHTMGNHSKTHKVKNTERIKKQTNSKIIIELLCFGHFH